MEVDDELGDEFLNECKLNDFLTISKLRLRGAIIVSD